MQFNFMETLKKVQDENPNLSQEQALEKVQVIFDEANKKPAKEGGKRDNHRAVFESFKNEAINLLGLQEKVKLTPKKKDDPQPLWSDLRSFGPTENTTINGLNNLLSDCGDDKDNAIKMLRAALFVCEKGDSPYHVIHAVYGRLALKYIEIMGDDKKAEFEQFLAIKPQVENKTEAPVE